LKNKRNSLPTYLPHIFQLYIVFDLIYKMCCSKFNLVCAKCRSLTTFQNCKWSHEGKLNVLHYHTDKGTKFMPQTQLCWGKITPIYIATYL